MFSDESGAEGPQSCMMEEKTRSGLKEELVGVGKREISSVNGLREGCTAIKGRGDITLSCRFCFVVRTSG